MRSTKASTAIARLNRRTENSMYLMGATGGGLFYLMRTAETGETETLSEPMGLEEFVRFVDAYGPQKPRKISKLDAAFEKQLIRKTQKD